MRHTAFIVMVPPAPGEPPQFRMAWGLSSESVCQFGNADDARRFKKACEDKYGASLQIRRVTVEIGEVVE